MRTLTLSHITYAAEWKQPRAAFTSSVEVDGITHEIQADAELKSPAVMAALAALESAAVAELAATGATVKTMRDVRSAESLAAKQAAHAANVARLQAQIVRDKDGNIVKGPDGKPVKLGNDLKPV